MAFNAIDGMLAREHGQQSVLGAYLNELGDIVSDLALIVPFVWAMPSASSEVIVFAVLAIMVECAGLIGPLVGASRRYDGPLGKSDRALVLGALGLWIGMEEAKQASEARADRPNQPSEQRSTNPAGHGGWR
jgi:phosphatidylglycerophosphate synthase